MILFYRLAEPFGDFSNFAKTPVQIDGKTWATTEHYYQAQKFLGEEMQEYIRNQPSARLAADNGRRPDLPLRPDWEEVKDDVMRRAVREKVRQYPSISVLLQNTRDEEIREHSDKELYWADGLDGSGKNMLGKIWMEVREEVRNGTLSV